MKELRRQMLTKKAAEFGITPSEPFPRVYGVVMDWPIGEQTVTVIGFSDGNASLYTTSTFGIIGGFSHEPVRLAAQDLVRASEQFYDLSKPTTDFSYPDPSHGRFYLLTFDGPRMIEVAESELSSETSSVSELSQSAQRLITALQQITGKGGKSQ